MTDKAANEDELQNLEIELAEARQRVADLEEIYAQRRRNLSAIDNTEVSKADSLKPVRVFIDGAFDLTHYGHMNAFRHAKSLGNQLVVGVNSDDSIAACKGAPPVLNDGERQAVVEACRFVDEIVPKSPYIMTAEYIQFLVDEHKIDFFVHGDDPCLVDGKDVYEAARKANRFRTIPRTDGISTTDIVGRMLLASKDHHDFKLVENKEAGPDSCISASRHSQFLVTSQLLNAFSRALPGTNAQDGRLVYVDGVWDMFHCGHVALLKKARTLGERVLVGVHSDVVANKVRGYNYPIMAMHERVLSVLACSYADDVLLEAPWTITREMIATLKIDVVMRGTVYDCPESLPREDIDPHQIPKEMGIHVEMTSETNLTVDEILKRLQTRRQELQARYQKKHAREEEWYRQKHQLEQAST